MMRDLGMPLFPHALKGRGVHDREANEEHIRVWIAERAKSILQNKKEQGQWIVSANEGETIETCCVIDRDVKAMLSWLQ